MLRVGLLALLLTLALSACGSSSDSEGEELTLRALPVADRQVRDADLDHAVTVLADRLERAGIEATVKREGRGLVVVELDGSRSADVERAVELSTRRGVLEFYDLEGHLVGPSIDGHGRPVATDSLYDLLVGQQQPAVEDETEAWYLFDPERRVAGGPAPTKGLLLPGGKLLGGWRMLGTPPGTVVLECGIGEVVCPGVGVLDPSRNSYYLIRHDPPRAPELDGGDLQLDGTRQDFDVTTGEPIVTMRFTDDGAERFGEITNREADRGRARYNSAGGQSNPQDWFQHFAIVLDREIKSWPSIDFEQYPNGIGGSNGAQISGIGDLQEAKDLALVLRTGSLPVRFEVVSRPAVG